jgi:predicted phage tail component-like protein
MHDIGLWVESFHISSPDPSRKFFDLPGMNGSYLAKSKIKMRKVEIGFQVETDSIFDLDELKHTIYGVFYSEKPYKIVRDFRPDRILYAVQDGEYDIENITPEDGEFTLSLIMPDPFLYGPEKTQIVDASGDPTITIPTLFASSDSPIVTPGTNTEVPLKADITFNAAASEYILEHQQSGKKIRLSYDFVEGDKVTIFSNWENKHLVQLNGENKLTMLVIPSSDYFYLDRGENTFSITPGENTETKITYRERWV